MDVGKNGASSWINKVSDLLVTVAADVKNLKEENKELKQRIQQLERDIMRRRPTVR